MGLGRAAGRARNVSAVTRQAADDPRRFGRAVSLLARLGLGIVVIGGLLVSLSNPISVVAFVPSAAVGSLLILRRPANPIGWLLLLFALGASFAARGRSVDLTPAEVAASGVPLATQVDLLVQTVFSNAGNPRPDRAHRGGVSDRGLATRSLRSRLDRRCRVPWCRGALQFVAPTMSASTPDGTTVSSPTPSGSPETSRKRRSSTLALLAGLALCIAGSVIRFRSAGEVERQQDKWLLAGLGFLVVSILWGSALVAIAGPDPSWASNPLMYALTTAIAWGPATIALTMPPVAIAIAVLRYRLHEIDRIVSRTISYALVTASLLAVYVGLVLLLQGR